MPDKTEAPKTEATFNQASVVTHEELEKQLQQKEAVKAAKISTGSREDLLEALQKQLEYYFSSDNLSKDTYLLGKMTPDKWVEISVIGKFTRVSQLTKDRDLIVEAMKRSKHMTVDGTGLLVKARPHSQRTTLILRNIPTDTHQDKVRAIFAECDFLDKLKGMKGDISNTWFLQWDTEDTCLAAAMWVNKHAKFQGEPVKCRVKSENFSRSATGSSGSFPYMPQYTRSFPYAPPAQQQGGYRPPYGPPPGRSRQQYNYDSRSYPRGGPRGGARGGYQRQRGPQYGSPNRLNYQQTNAYRQFRGGHTQQGRQRTYPGPPIPQRPAAGLGGGGRGRKPGYTMPPPPNAHAAAFKPQQQQQQAHKKRTTAPENKPKSQNVAGGVGYSGTQEVHAYDKESMFAILNKLQRQRKAVLPPGIVRTDEDMKVLLRKEPFGEPFSSKPAPNTQTASPSIRGGGRGGRGRGRGQGRGRQKGGRGRYKGGKKNFNKKGPKSEGNKPPKSPAPVAGKTGDAAVQSAGTSQAPIFLD